ncbi:AraC family transcriptional regulator [Virgibacillus necropolis]|uniref:AraC family transcriptional regulator n=1 Tax=Virgibacillus necropolis TaxID=163877 RepID=UPI00384C9D54
MNEKTSDLTLHGIHLKENKHFENDYVKSHHHPVYQILYALENNGEITFNEWSYEFSQDSVAFITPYSNHSIEANSKLTVLVLEFEIDKLDSEIQEALLFNNLNKTKLIDVNLFEAGELRQLLRRMLYEQSIGKPLNLLAMKILLSELLLILARSHKNQKILDANILRAERLRKYIDTHYFEVINSNDISTKVGISVRHINSLFKEQYNITPIQYLTEVRMEVAKKMLIETNKDIVSICFEVGFESLSTFYRSFKIFTDFSPNKFRIANQIPDINED